MSTDDNASMPPRLRRSSSQIISSEAEDSRSSERPGSAEFDESNLANSDDNPLSKVLMERQLRRLCVDNPGKFLENWNPESSNRETRKLTRKIYNEGSRKHIVYDERGYYIKADKDFCDCLEDNCPGCHFPCPKCGSPKCGHECRNNRRWTYDFVEIEGSEYCIKNNNK